MSQQPGYRQLNDQGNGSRSAGAPQPSRQTDLKQSARFDLGEALPSRNFEQHELQQQQQVMRQQDEQLDQVMHTVVNLKGMAQTIGGELNTQNQYTHLFLFQERRKRDDIV